MNRAKGKASQILTSTVLLIVCLPYAGAFAQSSKLPRSQSKTSLFDYALKESNRFRDDWKRQEMRAYIAEKYAESQQFDQALAVAEMLYEEWYQAGALTKIAVSLWKAGQFQRSELLFERVRRLKPRPNEKGSPTAGDDRLSDLIAAYIETFQYAKAIETAKLISYEHSRIRQFETILTTYFFGEQGELPEEWLNDLLKLGDTLELKPEKDQIKDARDPDERKRREEELESTKKLTIKMVTLDVALAYGRKGEFKRAEELVNQAPVDVDERENGYPDLKEATLSLLAVRYSTKGRFEDAFRLAGLISGTGSLGDRTWLLLAEEFASQNKHDLAQRALTEVMKQSVQPTDIRRSLVILNGAAITYKKLGQIEKSEQLFRTALERAGNYKDDRAEAAQLIAYVAAHAAIAGNYQLMIEALEALRKTNRDNADYVSVLGSIGLAATQQKQYEIVDKIISEITSTVDEHGSPNIPMLTWIAEGWLLVGEKEKAAQALQHAIAFKKASPGYTGSDYFRRLAVAMAKAERVDLLMEFADSIKVPDRDSLVFALADLGVEFAKHRWALDLKQRKILDRLIAASKESPRLGPPPPPMRRVKNRRR